MAPSPRGGGGGSAPRALACAAKAAAAGVAGAVAEAGLEKDQLLASTLRSEAAVGAAVGVVVVSKEMEKKLSQSVFFYLFLKS